MTPKPEKSSDESRRDFLKLSVAAAPAVAVVAATGADPAAAASPDPSSDTLQDTAHTRAYYDSARF